MFALLAIGGFQYLKMRNAMEDRRMAMEIQRQVLVDSWKEEGLTDEQIEEKLSEMRPERFSADGRTPQTHYLCFIGL